MKRLPIQANDRPGRNVLLQKGVKSTKQRLAVIESLSGSESPLSAQEIFIRIRTGFQHLSLSTVYRILEVLKNAGIVEKTGLMEGGGALYELNSEVHKHNLICVKCHKIIPIEGCPLGIYESNLEQRTGYKISGHKLEVYGICPKCRSGK
ncbi:MAG TPA: Fur family transcriptional regulator [Clostridia bacterium]|nr:Fur family transcriptional regulator [Clostridia bacterium]